MAGDAAPPELVKLASELNRVEMSGSKFSLIWVELDEHDAGGEWMVAMKEPDAQALTGYFKRRIDLQMRHKVALARELTAAAGYPLRTPYGYAASDDDVQAVVEILLSEPDDYAAAQTIGIGGVLGDITLASGYDTPTTEEYEAGIVKALRGKL